VSRLRRTGALRRASGAVLLLRYPPTGGPACGAGKGGKIVCVKAAFALLAIVTSLGLAFVGGARLLIGPRRAPGAREAADENPGHLGLASPAAGSGHGDADVVQRQPLAAELAAALVDARSRIERCLQQVRAHGPGEPAATAAALGRVLDSFGLSARRQARLRDLQASVAASPTPAPRTITFNVETSDGEAQIVDVPTGNDGSAFGACAQQSLRGRRIPLPDDRPGNRHSVTLRVR